MFSDMVVILVALFVIALISAPLIYFWQKSKSNDANE